MNRRKEAFLFLAILNISAFLRFYNLMHDFPYFFDPDERNMANSISQLRLPSEIKKIPLCLISQISQIGRIPENCNLNPNFYAYGQLPLYLSFFSDQIFQKTFGQISQIGQIRNHQPITNNLQLTTSFPSAIFWLRFWSAISSTLTVLIVFLISRKIFNQFSIFNFQFSIITALLAAFSPGLIQAAHFGTTESLLTFFYAVSIYLSFRLLETANRKKWKALIFCLSAMVGLGLGTKLTGLFFLIPPGMVFLFETVGIIICRKKILVKISDLIGVIRKSLIFITFVAFFTILSSPYNFIRYQDFKSSVFGYEKDVATGRYDAFYTKQFTNTTPILFQAEKVFPYTLGWPVFIFGSFGFLISIISLIIFLGKNFQFLIFNFQSRLKLKIFKFNRNFKLQISNYINDIRQDKFQLLFILMASFFIYFIPNAFLYAKWTRFMTPIMPFFHIFAAYTVFQIYQILFTHKLETQNSKLKTQNQMLKPKNFYRFKVLVLVLTFAIYALSLLPGAAFMSIYIHEDSRVTASKWIYDNIPTNSYVLSETANVIDIPLGLPQTDNLRHATYNYTVISYDFYHLDENPTLFGELVNHLEKSDYIFIPSRRILANFSRFPDKYPLVNRYYQLLFSSKLGFEKVAEISSFPQLPISQIGPISLIGSDENAEETYTVFDHPVIRIYKKTRPMTQEQYRILFETL